MRKAKDNPFATSRVERLLAFDPKLIGDTWDGINKRWLELGREGTVLGCHGSGKTTFLLGFADWLEGQGESVVILFFNDQKRTLNQTESDLLQNNISSKIVLVDGEECLSFLQKRRLRQQLKQAKGQLIAKHKVHSKAHSKVVLKLQPTEVLARQLLTLITEGDHYPDEIQKELDRVNGNLREMWLSRYDRWTKGVDD